MDMIIVCLTPKFLGFDNQRDKEDTSESDETSAPELSVVEPFRQRLRTISGDSSQLFRR